MIGKSLTLYGLISPASACPDMGLFEYVPAFALKPKPGLPLISPLWDIPSLAGITKAPSTVTPDVEPFFL